jgi:hypothetical protein
MRVLAFAGLLAFAASAQAQDATLYDTFNDGDQGALFDCCNTLPLVGGHKDGDWLDVHLPITVPVRTKIREVDVALSYVSGHNEVDVMLVSVGRHHPFAYRFHATNVPSGGQCCVFQTGIPSGGGIFAHAGNYELWLRVHGSTLAGWNLNSAGLTGPYLTRDQDGWHEQNGTLPAVRILTRPAQ